MKEVKIRNLKKGQVILIKGEFGKEVFEIAEIDSVTIHFKNWKIMDVTNGTLTEKKLGLLEIENKTEGKVADVLNSIEVINVNRLKNKMLMLENLDE